MEETVVLVFELIGTFAFAFSGAMAGLQKHMDVFGVWLLGLTTAVGGGMLRDLILGNTPPMMFRDPIYVMVASVTALGVFAVFYFKTIPFRGIPSAKQVYRKAISVFDSMGLGIFTVVGVNTAISSGFIENGFLMVFVGVVTGVGGGVLRDVLLMRVPSVLYKRIYAIASLVGAVLYVCLVRQVKGLFPMLLCAAVVVVIRLLADHYRWNLPVVLKEPPEKEEGPR